MAATVPTLLARHSPLASAGVQRESLGRLALAPEFEQALAQCGLHPLRPLSIDVLQVNVGKLCNQTCRHCHVDAGPDRREVMTRETMQQCLDVLRATRIPTVDITGGAPELNPNFRWFVEQCRALGRHVIDRCNLTILETAPHADLPRFFAQHGVEVVCSLPHYRQTATDTQRGDGVYATSIRALKTLNAEGYGAGNGLRLALVTNPVGAFLPASQASLEAEWKRELLRLHGVRFDALYCITNMPISRFLEWLIESGNLQGYMERLVTAFNPAAAAGVMCRTMLSVGWDGTLYDCDFNQMLDMPVAPAGSRHIRDFDAAALSGRAIVTGRHCFGCTAGAGSSCGGATA
ncbi:MAG TPA: arsenosugar biosynthesis radical SAM (seleno)protein ArsS [Candidatus Krumholzibacteria bacterium]|nr:arsenosugar biosynthesis radical SAM (seleno)protein ArsS [Candidatus Krumholzibacteria bacterium]